MSTGEASYTECLVACSNINLMQQHQFHHGEVKYIPCNSNLCTERILTHKCLTVSVYADGKRHSPSNILVPMQDDVLLLHNQL